ncbi:MAG TPA: gliding motility-associated C-terminal domain-containing protein [Flavisolibacter sp.]|jgi:gliding motility-associated-like protein|nr:gliding motility-associated C-terminal domain-containing protein [Flavisolibacter sp.]
MRICFIDIVSIFSFILLSNNLFAQAREPILQWQKTFGGSKLDWSTSICPTEDGGYVMAGYSESNDGIIKNSIGYGDFSIIKIDYAGIVQWQKSLGGTNRDFAGCIKTTTDGGYIVAGYSYSNDKDVSGNHGYSDCWIAKLDKRGSVEWQKCFGGSYNDDVYSIIQTSDGGFAAAGFTDSKDGDLNGNYGKSDCWIIKLNNKGDLQWQKRLGGTEDDVAQSIDEAKDGGYIVAGYTSSNDIDINNFKGAVDAWIIKLQADGNLEWQKCFGGSEVEYAESIQHTSDGGYVFTGMSYSKDGDVSNTHGGSDLWIVKLDKIGNLQWDKSFGGSNEERGFGIVETSDFGYAAAGLSYSTDGALRGRNINATAWVVEVTNRGQLLWQKNLGFNKQSILYSIKETKDKGLIAAGFTAKTMGGSVDSTADFYVVKLLPEQDLYIPNAFTPNGDGLNDVWNLSFLSAFPQCKVEIFNRWGQLIFSSRGYQTPWDGTYKGTKLPAGIYCYVIDRGTGLKKNSGTLVVIR